MTTDDLSYEVFHGVHNAQSFESILVNLHEGIIYQLDDGALDPAWANDAASMLNVVLTEIRKNKAFKADKSYSGRSRRKR